MLLLVKACTGKVTSVEAEAEDTVHRLKQRIQEKEGTPAEKQLLIFNSKRLDDGTRILSDYNIQDRGQIVMVHCKPPGSRTVTVKTLQGAAASVDVQATDTVADLKDMIKAAMGEEPEYQRLICNGKHLDDASIVFEILDAAAPAAAPASPASAASASVSLDGAAAAAAAPGDGDSPAHAAAPAAGEAAAGAGGPSSGAPPLIYMVRKLKAQPISITVKRMTAADPIKLSVDLRDTVGSVKAQIQEQEGHSPESQRLIFAGRQLDDASTLSECKVVNDSTLHLVLRSRPADSSLSLAYQPVSGSCDTVGACGLYNLGNTCFMNAILQALSNTVPLRQYYRSGLFRSDISEAPLSMKGRLASSFAELIGKMWQDSHTVLSPSELKALIAEKRPEFAGYQQHDAQEVLTFLLDGLHEDVNKAPYPRPIVEDPSTDGKTELQVADEAWSGNLRRNDSEIVNLFQFQLRSRITFPDVDDKSLKFDPMMYLSLPVPKPPHKVNITVVRRSYPQVAPTKHCFEIPKDKTFVDLEGQVLEACGGASSSSSSPSSPLPQASSPSGGGTARRAVARYKFASVYDRRVLRFFGSSQRMGEVRSHDTVWAFEVPDAPDLPDEELDFVAAHFRKPPASSSAASPSASSTTVALGADAEVAPPPAPTTFATFAAPMVLAVPRRRAPPLSLAPISETNGATGEAAGGDAAVGAPPPPAATVADVVACLREASSRIERYIGLQPGTVKLSLATVGPFTTEEGTLLKEEDGGAAAAFEAPQREVLAVNFLDLEACLQGEELSLPEPVDAATVAAAMASPAASTASSSGATASAGGEREVDLQQCLDSFTREEELSRDDWVKSTKTGAWERSLKKLDLWTAPPCLLVHLKRFGSELLGGPLEKVDTLVQAPIDLDLSPWVCGPLTADGAQYKLYAVVNHSGSLAFGHYTAYCRVGEGEQRQWYYFNDSSVTRADESEVVSKAAYILFYERVSQTQSAPTAAAFPGAAGADASSSPEMA